MTGKACPTETRLWRADEIGAEMLLGRFADFSYDQHTHDTACLALITAGAIRIRMRGQEVVAQAGDLYAIDADEPHAGWPVDQAGWSQRTVYADLPRLGALLDQEAPAAGIRGPIIRDADLTPLFMAMHRASETGRPRLLQDQNSLGFAALLFRRHVAGARPPAVGREDRAVRRARAYLDERLDERVSLEEIAAAAGLPPFRLYRAFERTTGMTPHGYQRQARIRRAIDLIRLGRPLAEVAAAAGFTDQAHLTRSFQRRMGVTPGAYRAARLAA